MQALEQQSNASQPGRIWCRNLNNMQFFCNKIFTKSDCFRHKMVCKNRYFPVVETMVDDDFERQICKWETTTSHMSKKEFEDCQYVCKLFFKIIINAKGAPQGFLKDRKIKFVGRGELGSDFGGLRAEALEPFNNNWLQFLVANYPKLFTKRNDLCITIDHIPKDDKEKKLIS